MQKDLIKEESLKKSIQRVLVQEDLLQHQKLVERLSKELGISSSEYAAALSFLKHPDLYPKSQNNNKQDDAEKLVESVSMMKQKQVRYRLDIGRKHQVTFVEIKNMLVDVSGVDKNRIGSIDIRNYYTLVDLPDGMTADIFQLLSETEMNQQRLNIKRMKYQRRFHRRATKKS